MQTYTKQQFIKKFGQQGVDSVDAVSDYSKDPSGYSLEDTKGDFMEMGEDIKGAWGQAGEDIVGRFRGSKDDTAKQRFSNIVGAGSDMFKGIGRTIGGAFMGAGKMALPQGGEDAVKNVTTDAAEYIASTGVAQYVVNQYQELDPEAKEQVDNILGYLEGATEIVAPGVAKKLVTNAIEQAARRSKTVALNAKDAVKGAVPDLADTPVAGGVQAGKEFLQRGPRAIEHLKTGAEQAAVRAERMKNATPAMAKAIEVNVPDTTLDIVSQVDDITRKDMVRQLDIADLGKKADTRTTSVAGDASAKQYTLIDNKRKAVGKDIEKAIDALPEKSVDMTPGLQKLGDDLSLNGLDVVDGKVTRTARSAHSNAELNAIQQLYDEAIRGIGTDGTLDALAIHSRDRLFSKLRRESRKIEGLDEMIVKTTKPDGTVGTDSIYNVFRDTYRTQLDELSPEMRKINTEYAKYRNFVDEMDNTIFKTSKTNQNIDPALSAAINLRRIESNALSQPVYAQAVKDMDVLARELGYEGSNPEALLQFALELETLYPTTVPKTGFAGGIKTGIAGIVDSVSEAGKPVSLDQQKALRALLEEGAIPATPTPKTPTTPPVETAPVSSTKSTTQKIADAILPGDTPGKEGGYVVNPFSKNKIKGIDAATKEELNNVVAFLKSGKTGSKWENLLNRLADKYGIPLDVSPAKQIAYINKLLDKTETMETLPGGRA